MHRTRQTYYFHSARPSHLLALRLRTNKHFADIFSIKSIDGTVLTDPKSVNTTFVSFYKDLYSSESGFVQSACDDFFDNIQMESLSVSDSENLNAPITHHEIEKAVMGMRKGRSPGPDGIPPEFYLTFWPLLGPLLVEMILFSIKEGSFLRDVNTALLSLLLKKGKDPTECASYTPHS